MAASKCRYLDKVFNPLLSQDAWVEMAKPVRIKKDGGVQLVRDGKRF
jgi:hypothetical protein